MMKRQCGILLHPTSLPGRFGVGGLGKDAFDFLDFLHQSAQQLWQILPLGPTGYGESPYSSWSAFAGNPLLICPEKLVAAGDLEPEDLEGIDLSGDSVLYEACVPMKRRLLSKAAIRFFEKATPDRRAAYRHFCEAEADWLDEFVLFRALRNRHHQKSWQQWPQELRLREQGALACAREALEDDCSEGRYIQYTFFEQWRAVRERATELGIRILGDIPIYVAEDSVDVWANQHLFHLDDTGKPTVVAGVPPDYFSKTGQRWGNPMYRWDRMEEDGFDWWVRRIRRNLELADQVRIDHFRGLESAWEIPASEATAVAGRWISVPGAALLETLRDELGEIPLVAEDLGFITPEVEALRDRFELPGMNILQFAFGSGADNPYLPHNIRQRSLVYTGTHDNDTTLGWWASLDEESRTHLRSYLGKSPVEMPGDLLRLALATVAQTCILPLQDVLALGTESRMNTPGADRGNWRWRLRPGELSPQRSDWLRELTALYGRCPAG